MSLHRIADVLRRLAVPHAPELSAPEYAPGILEILQLLHPKGRQGSVVFSSPEPATGKWLDEPVAIPALLRHALPLLGQPDQYVSCHRFFRGRKTENVAELNCCFVDLDYYRLQAFEGHTPEGVCREVLATLDACRIPAPSYVVASGRGLQAVWLHSFLPAKVRPCWDHVQRALAKALAAFGPDNGALDASRVLRLVGSVNSVSGTVARTIHIGEGTRAGGRISFEALRATLPLTREQVEARRDQAEGRRAEAPNRTRSKTQKPPRSAQSSQHLNRRTFYELVVADLLKVIRDRWPGGLPDGDRNSPLFCLACAAAWTLDRAALQAELEMWGRELAGWSAAKTRHHVSVVLRRAGQARQERAAVNGPSETGYKDPRYSPKAVWFIEQLGITPEEMRRLDLRALIDRDLRRERGVSRKRGERRSKGAVSRCDYQTQARANARLAAEAILSDLTRLGSAGAVAAALGISVASVRKRAQRARKQIG